MTLGVGLLLGPRKRRFLMSEVPLYPTRVNGCVSIQQLNGLRALDADSGQTGPRGRALRDCVKPLKSE